MSRSNPTEHASHPCTRWFEWDGAKGGVRYYDKEKRENVPVGKKFPFLVLDRLACIKGWHDDSDSGIYSNEVRDTRAEPMVVKAFGAKQILAEGLYSQIKDRVGSIGGNFTCNLYIGYRKDKDSSLEIGSLIFKGAALSAWMDFEKKHRNEIYKDAVNITGSVSGKKGKVEFETPTFEIKQIAENTGEEATELDKVLQVYLKSYFSRTKVEQVDQSEPEGHHEADDAASSEKNEYDQRRGRTSDPDLDAAQDDIPF